jgi:lysophospholipase L1-like esterase
MAAASAARQKLRILCFGDSLTAGYSSLGTVYHPYVDKMVQMVQMAFPDHEISTEVDGKPGDTVCHGFLERIERHCETLCLPFFFLFLFLPLFLYVY